MSLSDHECRGMAVKMLSQAQLNSVHRIEDERGVFLLPHEIARIGGDSSIRSHWGIPSDDRNQATHAERIKNDVSSLIREKKCNVDLADPESRANFDWHIFHSGIDFAYNGVKRASASVEEDPFR